MRRFLAVVLGATIFSMTLGFVIAMVYVLNLRVEAVPQGPPPEPTQVELDVTVLLPSSPNG